MRWHRNWYTHRSQHQQLLLLPQHGMMHSSWLHVTQTRILLPTQFAPRRSPEDEATLSEMLARLNPSRSAWASHFLHRSLS